LGVDRQRTEAAYRLVADAEPTDRAHAKAAPHLSDQAKQLAELRTTARHDCQERLRAADDLMNTLAELVCLAYEQCLCRELVIDDVVARIDEALEDLGRLGAARAEAEDACEDGAEGAIDHGRCRALGG
jgi:hypothetical protein